MRLLFLVYSWVSGKKHSKPLSLLANLNASGAEVSACLNVSALAKKGHKVFVLTAETSQAPPAIRNAQILPRLEKKRFLFSKEIGHLHVKSLVKKIIKENRIDCVFCESPLLWSGAIEAAKEEHMKIAIHVHDYLFMCPKGTLLSRGKNCSGPGLLKCLACYSDRPHKFFWPLYYNLALKWQKKIIKKADCIACISDFVKQKAQGYYGKNNYKVVRRILPPVQSAKNNAKKFDLFYAGRLSNEKGIENLLEASSMLLEDFPGLSVGIAGSGPQRKNLEALSKSLGLEKNSVFLGKKTHEETLVLMANAKIVVYTPLWNEPAGRTQFEAMSLGTPVIISSVGGLKEEFAKGAGEIVSPGNSEEIAAAAKKLLKNKPSKASVKSAAKKILQGHSEQEIVKNIEGCFK